MSILLESRSQSRESESREGGGGGIVQQPGSFYNGNPSSSIWGRSGSSFWKNAGLLHKVAAASPFDFGFPSQVSVPPPPVETLDSETSKDRPEVFVFGSIANAGSTGSSPGSGDRNDDCVSAGSGIANHASPPTFPVDQQQFSPVPPSFPSPSFPSMDQQQFSPAREDKEPSKPTTFTVGIPTSHHQTGNPRPRFSKLRKSTHPAKGKGVARGEGIERPYQAFTFDSRAASPDAANFQTGEPSITVEESAVVDSKLENELDKDGSSAQGHGSQRVEAREEDAGQEIPSSSTFVFTSMRNAVPVVPERGDSAKDAHSLVADLTALKMGEKGSGDSVPSSNPPPSFVFGASSAQAQSHPKVDESKPLTSDATFVFGSSGGVTPSIRRKKGVRKLSSRSRGVRSSSTSATDEQGSPMDFSPCPDTGSRLSPQMTGNNSEAEEHDQAWNSQFQFYSSEEVDSLSNAAADLTLGNQSDESKETNVPKTFAFTASSPTAPARRRPRRTPKPAGFRSKGGVTRSTSRPEVHGMDLDTAKIESDGWKQAAGQNADSTMPSAATPANRAAVEQACEKWRLRGNEAYASGDFPKAEEYYSLGINSVLPSETSQSCIRSSMLCYSNRAATRMVVGRMREALGDCLRAIAVDPNFLRVRIRAGSCHLSLGEPEAALAFFQDCLNRARDSDGGDSKIALEALEGLRKTQQTDEYFQRAWELLAANDHTATLRILNEALLICPYSEIFLELKARSHLGLRMYSNVIQLCEQTLVSAERNWTQSQQSQIVRGFRPGSSPKIWRSWATSKALFYVGRLKESLECLQKLGDFLALSGDERISHIQEADLETLSQFIGLVQQLLQYKTAGNEAFQAGRHTEAVEHYTAALACNSEARPFNAVLFCNRAAASQALGHIADAIADSSRAVALDPKYVKAISRRVTLHTLIRDYGQACSDLRRLISLLETESSHQEFKQARERLASAEEDLKKSHPVDHYLILGLESSCTAAEVKKAYRKLALRHHPDKAGQFVVRTDGGEDGKDVGEEIRNDAERLFKLIGEAYAILSDPAKRARYDADEDLRKLRNRGATNNPSSENHRYDRTHRRQRDRWDAWCGYAHQYQRWQNGPDAAQPDTYARQSRYTNGGRSAEFSWDDL
ncbi:uncharacterized protein LOC9653764 isoform X2 [Selaginella moellendorffii]|uniref:uncharacterized protein LOC9653764 isoform X2 n=1 Tax=Selaginella moellendorffii TaxID=88036 RepID=UPI000D1CEDD7|nr:uncharacterized protein LOC9653764 isoform X2 [Selaginella moellendorffii]|eukprot:XP_024539126.1 uncharacterized protein LOC9653764 isoform X2 [Selaginella moellendorffii]